MAYLPGFEENISYYNWSREQKIAYIFADYLVIALYGFLVLLALRNIWAILVKQSEYRNLSILAFYVFSLLAVTLRLVFVIWYWTSDPTSINIDLVQQVAKLGVGAV